MSLLQDIRSLDPQDPGRWPLPIRIGTIVLSFALLAIFFTWFFVYKSKMPELEQKQGEEQSLRGQFHDKHLKAVNLEIYEQQLKDIERSFGSTCRKPLAFQIVQ